VDCGRPAGNAPVCAVKLVAQQEAFDGICDKFWCHRRDRRRHPGLLPAHKSGGGSGKPEPHPLNRRLRTEAAFWKASNKS
jgi:hypothetical protein